MSLFERAFRTIPKPEEKRDPKKKEIRSTAGAVPVKNAKGEMSMEKVSVKRYVAGKIPEYASEKLTGPDQAAVRVNSSEVLGKGDTVVYQRRAEVLDHGRRQIFEPMIVHTTDKPTRDPQDEEVSLEESVSVCEEDNGVEEESDDDCLARRQKLREQLLKNEENGAFGVLHSIREGAGHDRRESLPGSGEEKEKEVDEEEDESSEYAQSDDDAIPRLKPVFVPKGERVTVTENVEEAEKVAELRETEMASKRKQEAKEIVADIIKEEMVKEMTAGDEDENVVFTDDEDEVTAFEAWKVRELKRIMRDVEEAESREAEKHEVERLRLMTEEERQAALSANPRVVTNKAVKGVYRYLQKYYHRGSFYLDIEDKVLKQDFAKPTLEDHFDKSVLPSVMQVKKFGMAGRTKYTHLVDQDTSCFEGAWSKKNELASFFANKIGGGMKQGFTRPSNKRKGGG